MGFIVLFVFLLVIGGVGFFVFKELKKTKEQMNGVQSTNSVETAQEFLPFKDVPANVVDLGNHHYRMIIETSSTNYKLKTPQEQQIIDMTFQEFLNGLTHPITLYVQTRKLDMTKILEHIEEENEKIVQDFPNMSNYANAYLHEMSNLEQYVGNSIQKKKYVIVPYEEALTMDIPEEEKYALSLKELTARANNISENLKSIGITTKILNKKELVELLYYTYHKDESGLDEDLLIKDYLSTFVETTNNPLKEASKEDNVDMILYQAQMKLHYELEEIINKNDVNDRDLFANIESVYLQLSDSRKMFEYVEPNYENVEDDFYVNNQNNY